MINKEHKCIFVHIPKTGGTSIIKALDMKRTTHKTAKELKEEYDEWDDFFSFSIVRNPWDRMVSIYFHFKRVNEKPIIKKKVDIPSTFSDFIYEFNEKKIKFNTILYQQQADWIYDDNQNLLVNQIYKFENYSDEVEKIFNKLGIKKKLTHERRTIHEHYSTYYAEETINIVKNLFEKDIILFGYEYE